MRHRLSELYTYIVCGLEFAKNKTEVTRMSKIRFIVQCRKIEEYEI